MTNTPVPAPQGGAVVPTDQQWASTGLEDMSTSDMVLPRIKIVQTEGLWQDSNSGLKMEVLRFIPIGLVKQRVLFHHNVENDDVPMCKSSDFVTGYPNPDAPERKSFPWELSGFNPSDFPRDGLGNQPLPCDGCALKDWGSSPISDAPYCSEQWTLPIYYDSSPDYSGEWNAAILTLQKSNIKPIRTYFTSFASSGKPPFVDIAQGRLKTQQRGQVIYSVASFTKEGESPRDRWMEFSEQYADMRAFLTRPPLKEDDGEAVPAQGQNNAYTGPPQQQAPVQQAPAAQDPWQATAQPTEPPPVQQQAPVQQPPAQPPVQQPPVQQAPAPVAQPAPPAQQAPPAQPAAPATQPPPAGQELPF